MSLELVNTLATFGTFFVIAATAIAAIVQLRHARSSNHIAAFNELRETQGTPEFQAAEQFVQVRLPENCGTPLSAIKSTIAPLERTKTRCSSRK